jgi:hypothetical protein
VIAPPPDGHYYSSNTCWIYCIALYLALAIYSRKKLIRGIDCLVYCILRVKPFRPFFLTICYPQFSSHKVECRSHVSYDLSNWQSLYNHLCKCPWLWDMSGIHRSCHCKLSVTRKTGPVVEDGRSAAALRFPQAPPAVKRMQLCLGYMYMNVWFPITCSTYVAISLITCITRYYMRKNIKCTRCENSRIHVTHQYLFYTRGELSYTSGQTLDCRNISIRKELTVPSVLPSLPGFGAKRSYVHQQKVTNFMVFNYHSLSSRSVTWHIHVALVPSCTI